MTVTLAAVGSAIVANPVLLLIILLCLGATVVNGATDAPNAIATVVGTKAMRPTPAIIMAAVCNFIGLVAIVKHAAESMGGSVAVVEPRLGGATVEVVLPAA